MDRRRYLVTAGTTLSSILAGCTVTTDTRDEAPDPTETAEPEQTVQIPEGTETQTPQSADPPRVRVLAEHHPLSPNQVTFSCNIELTAGIQSLELYISESTQDVLSDGLTAEQQNTGDITENETVSYKWDGESPSCTLEFTIDVSDRQNEDFGGRDYAGTEEWVFAPNPGLSVNWTDSKQDDENVFEFPNTVYPLVSNDDKNVQVEANKPAKFGNQLIFMGEFEVQSYRGDGYSLSLIAPTHSDPPSPDSIFEMIDFASERLQVGSRNDEITAFITTDPIREGGVTHSMNFFKNEIGKSVREFWVHENSSLTSLNNTVLHEYVHTRQGFGLDADMEWFTEASAEYYAARLTYHDNTLVGNAFLAKGDVTNFLHPTETYADQTLTAKEDWIDSHVPYRKGGYVLLALDEYIRGLSDGEASLQTVFYRMNNSDELIGYSGFVELVSEVAGAAESTIDSWCSFFIDGERVPPVPEGWEI